jgi:hypothetical protein
LRNTHALVWLVPIVFLVAALAPLPYGYYTFLRIIVCGAAIFLAWVSWENADQIIHWTVFFALIAVLFNPLIPIYLSREMWAPIDLVVAAIFGLHFWKIRVYRAAPEE